MNQPPNAFTIRTAELADADNITRLMKSEPGFWNDRWPESIVARTLAAPTTIALVAFSAVRPTEHQAEIAGFACAHHLGFRGYLSELIVAANHRGQGIASALLAAIEERLADQDCPLVITDAWRDAQKFYQQQGWTPPDAVLLRKHLPPAT